MNPSCTQTVQPQTFYQELDLDYLNSVSGGDKAFEKEMLQSLLSEMTEKMAALSAAIAAGDVKSMRLQSHSLKNLAALIGVKSLTTGFSEIEKCCEQAPPAYLLQTFLPCKMQWEHSKESLARLVSEG